MGRDSSILFGCPLTQERERTTDRGWMKTNRCLSTPLDQPMRPSYWLFRVATTSLYISCINITWRIVWLETTRLHPCFHRIQRVIGLTNSNTIWVESHYQQVVPRYYPITTLNDHLLAHIRTITSSIFSQFLNSTRPTYSTLKALSCPSTQVWGVVPTSLGWVPIFPTQARLVPTLVLTLSQIGIVVSMCLIIKYKGTWRLNKVEGKVESKAPQTRLFPKLKGSIGSKALQSRREIRVEGLYRLEGKVESKVT